MTWAIRVISLVGYSPDIYLPLINGAILGSFPGKPAYSFYFGGIVFIGLRGTLSAWRLNVIVSKREAQEPELPSLIVTLLFAVLLAPFGVYAEVSVAIGPLSL